ncbi:putative NT-3 growth factor receptor-like protein [Megalodesulfovibrio gigas DSM 1382 = ATCC 19364]|uniref:Putative NT-3 growth factor receptor-like protein n=1 Tax=Megalodesulfovibrio gigas (strain ATCC 19364 / DSM 1382 / NCIMB 9332 / VKM B-1759) TaxID=1121448 RepID=T2G9R9_MEGG1|nr:putative NT-3 growth factor receptor-like protein [Megalodesulfovibrio gigas DSM 1382 = ATCC 19364]
MQKGFPSRNVRFQKQNALNDKPPAEREGFVEEGGVVSVAAGGSSRQGDASNTPPNLAGTLPRDYGFVG